MYKCLIVINIQALNILKSIYLTKNVSYQQVPSRSFPAKNVLYTYCERKNGTPVFQKTCAKEIKNL